MTEPPKRSSGRPASQPPTPRPPQGWRGQALGLPPTGSGSLAPFGRRLAAYLIDGIASGLVASLFVTRSDLGGGASHLPGSWSLVPFAFDYVLGMLLFGRTLGMGLLGLRIVRVDQQAAIGPVRAVARTALLMLFIPALLADRDLRGLHDRATMTAVIVQ